MGSEPAREIPFHPAQSFRDSAAILVVFAIVGVLALRYGASLGPIADPTDTTYIPRPDWYFLFLFQMLKGFPGRLEVLGTVVLPTIFIVLLFALPVLDRNPERQLRRRPLIIGSVVLGLMGWTVLTLLAYVETPETRPSIASLPAGPTAGAWVFQKRGCSTCHAIGKKTGPGPALTLWSAERDDQWLFTHMESQSEAAPGTLPELVPGDIDAAKEMFRSINPETIPALEAVPDKLGFGAALFYRARCMECHEVNRVGGNRGPRLNGVGNRHRLDWIKQQILQPRSHNPESIMNEYPFDPDELDALTSYLLSLRPE
ncbi:MAG: c-type cytochrome [Acidobacteria bacterium]|nr:c-type cytochrome [Acidobacteriota bacterium]